MTSKVENYVLGRWTVGTGEGRPLHNAVNGQLIGHASTEGINMAEVLKYGRTQGGQALRNMTFRERGLMLKKLALHLFDKKDTFYPISYQTGATKKDSWIDIEGGIGNLFANASLRRQFPDTSFHVEGDHISLSKDGSFMGHHIMVPKEGVAIHINAFNFPIWGMLEKIAVNLLAGVPAVVKPATVTSFLTEAMVREIISSGILPEGALQLLCGSARDLLDHVMHQDVVTFTGSAQTGRMLKRHDQIIDESVPFNMEADSLNCAVLGPDVTPDDEDYKIFLKEVRNEMTTKCGQKCTAIRRVFVPEHLLDQVQADLSAMLTKTTIGDPKAEGVRMGSLAGATQLQEVREQVGRLLQSSELVHGTLDQVDTIGEGTDGGAFISPMLMVADDPWSNEVVHNVEAFGPAATLMPYTEIEEAVQLSKMGKGSLCCSITTSNAKHMQTFVRGAASHHGRILVLNRKSAPKSTGHGSPLPLLVHGGPGRAGGGEEMGGVRGVKHYLQRCAIQGHPTDLTSITEQYQPGGAYRIEEKHPFMKTFDELTVGDTVITRKRTITEADIVQFANVSWDHFYAHTDVTSLEGTTFEQRVAHGYFILSAAAGLFVDGRKGPVLLNYGLDQCRFTKPVYPGMTIGVRLTVKEKIAQEPKDENDIPKGIVKFYVDVYDETGETVAIATILTMVRRDV